MIYCLSTNIFYLFLNLNHNSMKNLFNILVLFLLVSCSLFAQSWADLPKVLNGPTLTGINLSYPSIGTEGLFAGNFSGTVDGTVNSPGVIKFNSATQTFSAVSGFTANEVKGFFNGPSGLKYSYGDYGIKKFNASGTSASLEFSSTGTITAAWYFNGTFLVYGPTLTNLNGTTVNKIAKIVGTTVTSLPELFPTGASSDIYNIRDDGSDFIILGDFTTLGSMNTTDIGLWDGVNVFSTTGIPSNGYARDLENSILGQSQSPMGFAGSAGYSLGGPSLKSEDVTAASDGSTWVCGAKISGGPNSRIYSWNGSWNDVEGGLINPPYKALTNLTFYGMVAFPGCMVVFGNFLPPVSHCTFMAQTCGAPMPVKLSSLKGISTDKGNNLFWKTESEVNNFGFEIESSEDGETFKKIGLIEGKNSPSDYSFLDENPKKENYYRLKQMDFDDKFEYSKIIFLENKNIKSELKIYPNPVSDFINIDSPKDIEEEIVLRDISGKNIFLGKSLNETFTKINVSELKKGIYFLQIGEEIKKITKL